VSAVLLHGFTGGPASFRDLVAGAGLGARAFAPFLAGHGATVTRQRTGAADGDQSGDESGDESGADPPGFRIFDVAPGARLALDGVVIRGGHAPADAGGGGAVRVGPGASLHVQGSRLTENSSADVGAALSVSGFADVVATTIIGNRSGPGGSTVENAGGLLQIVRSTIAGNRGSGGSTLRDAGQTEVVNSTVVDNTGHEAALETTGTLDVVLSTVARNDGNGVVDHAGAAVTSSLVTGNTGAACVGATITGGDNLSGDGSCPGTSGDARLGPLEEQSRAGRHRAPAAQIAPPLFQSECRKAGVPRPRFYQRH